MNKLMILYLMIILLILSSKVLLGQAPQEPLFYLNSKQIDIHKLHIDPKRIDSIKTNKNSNSILIFTKNGKFPCYSIGDILRKFSNIKEHSDSILFGLNGKIINDTASIRIDTSYYIYVDIEKLSDVKYISKNYRDLIIANIDLEDKKREPKIYIRGDEDLLEKYKD